jgi:hypothetical protein
MQLEALNDEVHDFQQNGAAGKIISIGSFAGKDDGLPTTPASIRPSVSVTTVTTRIRKGGRQLW